MPALPADLNPIVITASRAPEAQADTPASVTVLGSDEIERLDQPLISNLIRLTPSAAVTSIGPAGSLTEVRIRGSEANHTLLLLDGIKVNDPASGDAPRFELLNADLASRMEVVRGPQSALWGSDAIGGVIAINGVEDARGLAASAEAGSFGSARTSASAALSGSNGSVAGAIGWQRAAGIDSFGSPGGDRDGYRNLSARLRGSLAVTPNARVGATLIALSGMSEFDGYDPLTFQHTDTRDSSRNRLAAARVWGELGDARSPWRGSISASLLGSSNRNLLAGALQNRTSGTRRTLDAQVERSFATGAVEHRLIVAAEAEREGFRASDIIYGGFTDQDRSRSHHAVTAEWRATSPRVTADLAVRRDMFNRFRDATSLRASALGQVGGGFSITGSYAQGIAQPTFFDLYGFFPGNFVGNSSLKPESSREFEVSGRYRSSRFEAAVTLYRQRLHDEIVDVSDPSTFLQTTVNRAAVSRRSGIEAEAGWSLSEALRLRANYAYLHATEPEGESERQAPELRRPKHSGSVEADGAFGRWSYGASVAYTGARLDRSDNYPFGIVTLRSYWLANARLAYAWRRGAEVYLRTSNLFAARYEDSAGYRTEGRGVFVGLRLTGDRRSSP